MTTGGAGSVRPPAVAGLFYPADPDELRSAIRSHLATAPDPEGPPAKAVIAPHAGYRYSGPTAAHAYAALAGSRGTVERVVVIGPAHRVPLEGVGVSTARAWSTPLGPVEVDREAVESLAGIAGVVDGDEAQRPEHSIEVHLPFIREVLGPVPVVPLVVGRATSGEVGLVLRALWGDDRTAIVASSDLSHYLDEPSARARDRRTVNAILEGRARDIGPRDACGCLPIGGLLTAAAHHGLAPYLLDLSTSSDTGGDATRVVGYGSFAFRPPPSLSAEDRGWLVRLATDTVRAAASVGGPGADLPGRTADPPDVPDATRRPGASFVTLTRHGELLGCIGTLEPVRALWRDVAHNARSAACDDPRFPALTGADLDGLAVEVSVLSTLDEVPDPSPEGLRPLLRPGVDGLVVAGEGKRATFLPTVWDKIPNVDDFVRELARKAGWEEPWVPGARAWRYTTDVITL